MKVRHINSKRAEAGRVAAKWSADHIDISRDIQKIQEILKNTPDVRIEKVKELKTKIQNNQYRVDAREIANKIISHLIKHL